MHRDKTTTKTAKSGKEPKKENVHAGHRKRMREKCIANGTRALQNHELIEMLLYYCIPMKDTNVMAHKVMNTFGSFQNLLSSDFLDIKNRCGFNDSSALFFNLIGELYKRSKMEEFTDAPKLNNGVIAGEYAISLLSSEKVEKFYMLCLDVQCRLISTILLGTGTSTGATVSFRTVVDESIRCNAVKVIFTHNHPGGTTKPSKEDLILTRQLSQLLKQIEVEVVDHIIVAGKECLSIGEGAGKFQ